MNERARLRVVVLISGEGTNLQALIDAERRGEINIRVQAVISDRDDARGLERARVAGIPAHQVEAGRFDTREAYDRALVQTIERYRPGLIVLAGFMRILGPAFVGHFAGCALNIHPSLLPRYRGLDTHRRVLEGGDRFHGATVHFVTDELDGGPHIIQYRIPVRAGDDPQSLAARVHVGEHIILPRAVGWFADARLRVADGTVILDGRSLDHPVLVEGEE